MTTHLEFSIGPVQGFLSQSRRTRDLWGSSYLLAFLSAHAIRGTERAGAEVVRPLVEDDPLYRWVCGERTPPRPGIGTVPNHFVVNVNGNARDVAAAAVSSLDTAWRKVCDAVWAEYVSGACSSGQGTEAIWRRQTSAYWEVMWTAGSQTRHGLLARRKRWRTHRLPAEPGDKCTVMDDLQELSGFVRKYGRAKQDGFWDLIRATTGALDLRDDERLCAVALVKRLFPRVAREALGWHMDASHWPSTVHVAAVPWIRRVRCAVPRRAASYAKAVRKHAAEKAFPIRDPDSHGLGGPDAGNFPKVDANYLHRDFVASERRCPLKSGETADAREELLRQLQAIRDAEGLDGRVLGPPPSFYAMVLADGDRLGRLVGRIGGGPVSCALAKFTGRVPGIVREKDGVTVYAGGDDVLAMLPAATALACATALSEAYRDAFAGTGAKDEATLSAAVAFAQIRLPLGHVRDRAHRLLDEVAKEGNGRNSLAAAVLKPGGLNCQWVTTWVRPGRSGGVPAVDQLDALVKQLGAERAEPGLSSALVYRMREILARLCGWDRWRPGTWRDIPRGVDLRAFLRAEIAHSLDHRMDGGAAARSEDLTAAVWDLLPPARNPRTGSAGRAPDSDRQGRPAEVGVDAFLLARFLADPKRLETGA